MAAPEKLSSYPIPQPKSQSPKPRGTGHMVVVVAVAVSLWEPLPISTKHAAFHTQLNINWGLCPQQALGIKGVSLS